MKIKLILLMLTGSIIFMFNACKDSGTDPGPGNGGNQIADSTYFPTSENAFYKYTIERIDSNGAQTTGTRSSFYSGTDVKGGVTYRIQVDSLILTGQPEVCLLYTSDAADE